MVAGKPRGNASFHSNPASGGRVHGGTLGVSGRQSRRQFLHGSVSVAVVTLLAGCQILPLRPQDAPKVPRIGALGNYPSATAPFAEALRHGLREHGYVEGENIAFEWRWAEGNADRFPELAAELVRLNVDILFTGAGTPASLALKNATSTIPIVTMVADPVAAGLVASLARPGGNVTGLANVSSPLSAKRLELLKEVVPELSRAAVLSNADNPAASLSFRELEEAARPLAVQLHRLEVRGPNLDLEGAFEAARSGRAEALVVLTDSVLFVHRTRIASLAAQSRLPSIHEYKEYAEAGGLLVYGPNLPDLWWRSAAYVAKILKGAKPADLPVEQPTKFDLVINLKTAQALGLTIPQSVLMQAKEIIQ